MDKISQEWMALTHKKNRVLFYNTKRAQLEGMAYRNIVERFFKILLYYLKGYRKNTGLLFRGIDDLLTRSLKVIEGKSDNYFQILPIMLQVQRTVLPKLMENFRHQSSDLEYFAANYIQQKLKDLIDSALADQSKSQIVVSSNEVINDEKENFVPPPPPPPTPDLIHSKGRKAKKIRENIEKEKKLVNFLQLSALQQQETYQKYVGAKMNLAVFMNKKEENANRLQNVSHKTVEKVLDDIEGQLQNPGQSEITIKQEASPKQYKRSVAQKTASTLREILDTQKKISIYQKQVDLFAKGKIIQGDVNLSCQELELKLDELSARYKDLCEGSRNLKFHQTLLFNYENQLRELKGKKKLKRNNSKEGFESMNTPKIDFKKVLGNIASACTKKVVKMKEEEPDLSKL